MPSDSEILTRSLTAKTVYRYLEDLRVHILDKLNQNHGPSARFSFKLCVTDKYITLRCTKCSVYNYWFKNTEAIDMKLYIERGILVRDEKSGEVQEYKDYYDAELPALNLVLFRSIN